MRQLRLERTALRKKRKTHLTMHLMQPSAPAVQSSSFLALLQCDVWTSKWMRVVLRMPFVRGDRNRASDAFVHRLCVILY